MSAGIHGALVPHHLDERTAAGVGFAGATIALAAVVAWLTLRPASRLPVLGAAATLAGLLGSYALAVTTGVPILHPDSEPADALALATKAIEVVGLLAAISLLCPAFQRSKGSPSWTRHAPVPFRSR